jgi:hypothetical protein
LNSAPATISCSILAMRKRRNAQHIASLQTIRNLRAPTIHAHLAATHDAVNVALGHPLHFLQQQVVEPLPMLILGNQL